MKYSCEHLQVKGCQILWQHYSLDTLTGNFQWLHHWVACVLPWTSYCLQSQDRGKDIFCLFSFFFFSCLWEALCPVTRGEPFEARWEMIDMGLRSLVLLKWHGGQESNLCRSRVHEKEEAVMVTILWVLPYGNFVSDCPKWQHKDLLLPCPALLIIWSTVTHTGPPSSLSSNAVVTITDSLCLMIVLPQVCSLPPSIPPSVRPSLPPSLVPQNPYFRFWILIFSLAYWLTDLPSRQMSPSQWMCAPSPRLQPTVFWVVFDSPQTPISSLNQCCELGHPGLLRIFWLHLYFCYLGPL